MHQQHCYCLETLSNEVRIAILARLEKGATNVTELAAATGKERSLVSHALQQLKACHLVNDEKVGREVHYSLNQASPLFKRQIGNIFTLMESHAKSCCATCVKHGGKPFEESL